MSRTADSVALPPPGDYGDDIRRQYNVQQQLRRDDERRFEALGDRRLRALVRRVVDDDASHEKRCKLMQEKENYRIYEVLDAATHEDEDDDAHGDSPEAAPAVTMKGVLLLQSSSCEEVLELLATPAYADLFGAMYADSAVLHESAPVTQQPGLSSSSRASTLSATPVSTSLAYHWLMLRDVSPLLPARDFLFMRYNQLYASEDPASAQRVGWGASIYESIALPRCKPLWKPSVSQRSVLTKCGFIVEATDRSDSTTRVTFFVTAPQAADRQWLLKLAASVRLLPSAIVNHRIRLGQLVDKRAWILRDACALCTATFSKLRKRRHHCRLCGASVCSKCTAMRHHGTVRVCLSCINGHDTSALFGTVSMARKKLGHTKTTASTSPSWDPHTSKAHSHSHSVATAESWSSTAYGHSLDFSTSSSTSSMSSYTRGSALEDFLDGDAMTRPKLSVGSMSMSSTTSSSMSLDEDDVTDTSSFDYPLTYARGNPWPDAPLPASEAQRLQRLKTLNLSLQYTKDSLKELLDLARTSISCPVAAVTAVGQSKIALVTAVGLAGDQLPRDVGFEAHTIMSAAPLIVLDTQKDERFAMNPLVSSMNIRFYIGLPLVTRDGVVVGALSLGDKSPRDRVNGSDLRSLQRIATRIVAKMDASDAKTPGKVSGVLLI